MKEKGQRNEMKTQNQNQLNKIAKFVNMEDKNMTQI